jgi:hypothetical protein
MMLSILLLALMIFVQVTGLSLFALSQLRHWRTVSGSPSLSRRPAVLMRVTGFVLVSLSLPVALWRDGPSYGSLMWVCTLSASAMVVVVLLTWWPNWCHRLLGLARPLIR